MLRAYIELQQRINSLRERFVAEDGTTVPEYMLVLGFISLIIVVAYNSSGVSTAINAMSTNLATKINP